MLILYTRETTEQQQLRLLCERLGAPQFQSHEQMARWIRAAFKSDYWWLSTNQLVSLIDFVESFDNELFRPIVRALYAVKRLITSVRRTTAIATSLLIRGLLRLNPHSLPAESTSF